MISGLASTLPLPWSRAARCAVQIMTHMGVEGLTIFHVKSHLQKIRLTARDAAEPAQSKCGSEYRRWKLRSERLVVACTVALRSSVPMLGGYRICELLSCSYTISNALS